LSFNRGIIVPFPKFPKLKPIYSIIGLRLFAIGIEVNCLQRALKESRIDKWFISLTETQMPKICKRCSSAHRVLYKLILKLDLTSDYWYLSTASRRPIRITNRNHLIVLILCSKVINSTGKKVIKISLGLNVAHRKEGGH